MNTQRFLIALTVVNVASLAISLARPGAAADGVAPVLRGRALEIVDDRGRVRASITVFPADPAVKMPDGTTGYPETVLLRLITSKGRPNIKIAATEDGSGVAFGGESDPTYIQFLARGTNTSIRLVNKRWAAARDQAAVSESGGDGPARSKQADTCSPEYALTSPHESSRFPGPGTCGVFHPTNAFGLGSSRLRHCRGWGGQCLFLLPGPGEARFERQSDLPYQ